MNELLVLTHQCSVNKQNIQCNCISIRLIPCFVCSKRKRKVASVCNWSIWNTLDESCSPKKLITRIMSIVNKHNLRTSNWLLRTSNCLKFCSFLATFFQQHWSSLDEKHQNEKSSLKIICSKTWMKRLKMHCISNERSLLLYQFYFKFLLGLLSVALIYSKTLLCKFRIKNDSWKKKLKKLKKSLPFEPPEIILYSIKIKLEKNWLLALVPALV